MMDRCKPHETGVPNWVPMAAQNYLAHTVSGRSIRSIARTRSCHPSTILRQVRKLETWRDDPLVDGALNALSEHCQSATVSSEENAMNLQRRLNTDHYPTSDQMSPSKIDRVALVVLRRLCESGAVMAVARDMETAVVVREDSDGGSVRTSVVEREIAQALALKEWISCKDPDARIARYFITNAGRDALRKLTAEDENRANGFGVNSRDRNDVVSDPQLSQESSSSLRYLVTESPLIGLARRRDRDGSKFLSQDQVDAGERIRQDYEIAQIDLSEPAEWYEVLEAETAKRTGAARDACDRLTSALQELGPGLSDIVIRCCCCLDGLEITEKKMGWSARSGKIVLRIALTRLIRHYHETYGKFGPMIG